VRGGEADPDVAPAEKRYNTSMVASLIEIGIPGRSARGWHVSPLVDSLAYHWSWLLALVPMSLLGESREDYFVLWVLVLALNFAHRHLTLPIVYCDREVFDRHPVRFTLVPIAVFAVFLAEPALRASDRTAIAFVSVATVSGAWGIWHTLQQKYGILRLYAVKSELPDRLRPPPWVDRLLVHGWFPLWALFLGTAYRDTVDAGFARARPFLAPVLDALPSVTSWLLPAAAALAAASVGGFLWYEWRGNRFGNPARLFMGLGTASLSCCFLLFDPVKVFLAYTFSHAVEYFVFVWAYQRKRYAAPTSPASLMKRLLRHPAVYYWSFLVATGGVYVLMKYWGVRIVPEAQRLKFAGISGATWVYYWGIAQSMIHFYYDGFLWKMRSPETRANV